MPFEKGANPFPCESGEVYLNKSQLTGRCVIMRNTQCVYYFDFMYPELQLYGVGHCHIAGFRAWSKFCLTWDEISALGSKFKDLRAEAYDRQEAHMERQATALMQCVTTDALIDELNNRGYKFLCQYVHPSTEEERADRLVRAIDVCRESYCEEPGAPERKEEQK